MTRVHSFLLCAVFPLLALSCYVHLVSASGGDKSWLLTAARMWLSGKRLYSDIFEVNPPLILWIYAVPVWLSQYLPLPDYSALSLLGLVVTALVIAFSTHLIALHPAFAGHRQRQMAFALLLALVFIFLTSPMLFFDREHILLVLTFPYMLRFTPALAQSNIPRRTRWAVGLLAAIGFCIKPKAVIIFSVLQLLIILHQKSIKMIFSLENRVIGVVAAIYVLYVLQCMPEYLNVVIPMAVQTYAAYSRKIDGIYSIITFILIMGLTFADFRPRYASPYRRDIYYFIGVCVAFLFYALANNGWGYTYNPLISMARFLSGWVLLEFLWLAHDAKSCGLPVKPFIFGARACMVNLALNIGFFLLTYVAVFIPQECGKSPSCLSSKSFYRQLEKYDVQSFGSMSLNFSQWSWLSHKGARWDTRFNHLWMLPQFIISDKVFAEKNQWIIDYVGSAYAEDLNAHKPQFVFVDASPQFYAAKGPFDLPGYFSNVPAFAAAWSLYRRDSVIDACIAPDPAHPELKGKQDDCRFDVYRRSVP